MIFNTKNTIVALLALTAASVNAEKPVTAGGGGGGGSGKAEFTCAEEEWVPRDNTKSPTKNVRCCAGVYDDGKYMGSCDTSSCPNNFNHMKNRNCFSWGATNHNEDNFNPKGGSNNCPYAGSDHAICDTSYYTERNPESCRSNSNGQKYQNHCLGKVKCNTVGITYLSGGGNKHSDGTADHDDTGVTECLGATFGFKAGDDCFYNGSSENWKVCGPGEGEDMDEDPEEPEPPVEDPPATTEEPDTPEDPVTTEEPDTPEEPVTTDEPEATVVEVRATTDDPMTTTSKPGTQGDPHFKTHGGEMYDFHGGCDLVLLDNPDFKDGLGMLVHIRTKIETWWSYVESSVVRIGDDETIEISDRGILVNGAIVEPEQNKPILTKFAGLQVRYIKIGDNYEAHIYLSGNEKLLMKTFKGFVKVQIAAQGSEHYRGSHGLLGNFPDGTRVGRDGVTLIEDVNAFGQEWQIREDEPKLFSSYNFDWVVPAGQKCAMPDSSAATALLRNRRLADGMSMEQVQKACSHLESADDRKACEFDVIATQDESMASVW